MDQLAKVIQQRLLHDERVGIIVPKNRYVYGFAQALSQRGVPVEKAVPHRKSASTIEYDFGNSTPKIATFHSAKGLTFDSVLLPRLTAEAFSSVHTEALRMRMLFVGIARAMQWVYLSTQRDQEMTEWRLLQDAIANRHLTILEASTVPPRHERDRRYGSAVLESRLFGRGKEGTAAGMEKDGA
jgi:superfamily I DNA/RNA helicase